MERRVKKYLEDILLAITDINSYIGTPRRFADYKSNSMLQRAIERELEIIGEAMNRILIIEPTINIGEARNIVDFRNRIIHGYDSIDDELVWRVIIEHLPKLKSEVGTLLKQE
jgi:uncharacterized protein with HEPN domain